MQIFHFSSLSLKWELRNAKLSSFRTLILNRARDLFAVLLLLGSVAYFNLVQAESEVLLVEHSWIREAPPGVPTLAAYMNITNTTEAEITILGLSSNIAKMTELHEVKMDNDVMQMRKMSEVILDPGETLELKAGGSHVMLMGVQESFQQGDEIEIEFKLNDHLPIKVIVPVKKSYEF